jgi:type II secretion system protein N
MIARLKRLLPFLGYGLFYLLVFFCACYFTFPYDKLRDRFIAGYNAEQKGRAGAPHIEIEEVSPYWLSGVQLRGVRISTIPAPRFTEPEEPPSVVEIDEVRGRFAILSRIFGKTKFSFDAKAFGGTVDGVFTDTATERTVSLNLQDLAMGRLDMLATMVGLPLFGSLSGKVELVFPEKRFSKSEGTITLTASDFAVGDGVTKIKGALALPKLKVGELSVDIEAREGGAKINKLGAAGGDLDVITEGSLRLRDTPVESTADIYLRFKFSDNYKNRNDLTKSLFIPLGGPTSTAQPLFEMADPKIHSAKRTDGFYGWHMSGMLSAPRFDAYSGTPPANAGRAPTIMGKPTKLAPACRTAPARSPPSRPASAPSTPSSPRAPPARASSAPSSTGRPSTRASSSSARPQAPTRARSTGSSPGPPARPSSAGSPPPPAPPRPRSARRSTSPPSPAASPARRRAAAIDARIRARSPHAGASSPARSTSSGPRSSSPSAASP